MAELANRQSRLSPGSLRLVPLADSDESIRVYCPRLSKKRPTNTAKIACNSNV